MRLNSSAVSIGALPGLLAMVIAIPGVYLILGAQHGDTFEIGVALIGVFLVGIGAFTGALLAIILLTRIPEEPSR